MGENKKCALKQNYFCDILLKWKIYTLNNFLDCVSRLNGDLIQSSFKASIYTTTTTTTTTTNPLIPNKLGYTRNETQSKNIRSKISNINDNNEDDERK
jgi:hypothetical protein